MSAIGKTTSPLTKHSHFRLLPVTADLRALGSVYRQGEMESEGQESLSLYSYFIDVRDLT